MAGVLWRNEADFLTMSRKRRRQKGPRTKYTLHGTLIDMLPLTRPRLLKVPMSYEFTYGLDPHDPVTSQRQDAVALETSLPVTSLWRTLKSQTMTVMLTHARSCPNTSICDRI